MHILLRARLTPSCRSYLAVTRKRSHAFAGLLLFPEVSSAPPPLSSSSSLSSFPLVRHRWKTLKIRVISGGRGGSSSSASSLRFFLLQQWRDLEEGERSIRRRSVFYGYLSKHFVRGLDTWWIFQGPSLGPVAPPRCDYEFFGTPRLRPTTEDRARNVLAARFCLKREFHSRIRLM